MKFLLFLSTVLITVTMNAQVTKVRLEASGLTCSMCSNAIHKSLKTLDFIDKIEPDIRTYTFEITFKAGREVDFNRIKNKVEDAGFSVSGFVAVIGFDKITVKENEPIKVGNSTLYFVNNPSQALSGEVMVKVLDKGFVTSKEYRRNNLSGLLTGTGVYHVRLDNF